MRASTGSSRSGVGLDGAAPEVCGGGGGGGVDYFPMSPWGSPKIPK